MMHSRTLSEEDSIVLDCSHAQLPLQQGNSQDNESGDAKKGEGAKTSSLVSPILPRRRKRGLKREVHDMKTTEAAECSPSDDDGSLPSTPSSKSPSYSFPPENTTVPFTRQKSASLNETPPLFWNLSAPSSPPLYHSYRVSSTNRRTIGPFDFMGWPFSDGDLHSIERECFLLLLCLGQNGQCGFFLLLFLHLALLLLL